MRRSIIVAVLAFMVAAFALIWLAEESKAVGTAGDLVTNSGTYSPSKVSGPTTHYETPDVNPTFAYNNDHQWVGNGSEHLPCENGIHWISNANVLTVSHCLDGGTTTTSTPSSSTTPSTSTVPPTTSAPPTTVTETTSTSSPTTTSVPSSSTTTTPVSTTEPPSPTTTVESTVPPSTTPPSPTSTFPPSITSPVPELPATGPSDWWPTLFVAALLLGSGAVLAYFARRQD